MMESQDLAGVGEKMDMNIALSINTDGIPEWIRVLPRGWVSLADGRPGFEVDQEAITEIINNFAARGLDMVIDYEHQSLEGGQAPAAGWIKALEGRADGLWARVEWTAKGREYLQNREYRYFSPVLALDHETRKPVALLQVGLTNTPAMNHLPPLVAKCGGSSNQGEMVGAGLACPYQPMQEIRPDAWVSREDVGKMKEQLQESGPVEATRRVAPAETLDKKEILRALGLSEGASRSETLATIAAFKSGADSVSTLEKVVAQLKAELAARDAQELVELALKTGKVTPAQQEWAVEFARQDPEGFKIFLAKAPRIVPIGNHLELIEEERVQRRVDPSQTEVNRLMGITDEIYLKYNSEGRD